MGHLYWYRFLAKCARNTPKNAPKSDFVLYPVVGEF